MWVWSVESPGAIVEFAERRGLDELFVHVPWNVGAPDVAPLARLVEMAHARGLRTSALGGAPGWLDDPDGVVDRWLRPLVATNLFERLHLDIEPAGELPDFTASVVERFVAVVRAVAEARPAGWPLELDVRFWYPAVPAGDGDLTSALVDLVDAVTVLSYRNRTAGPDGSIALAQPTVAIAAAAGKSVRVGQETKFVGTAPHEHKQTFHGHRHVDLETAMIRIDAAFAGLNTYTGTAVHDWHWYRQLRD
jgi:hypothetical protein